MTVVDGDCWLVDVTDGVVRGWSANCLPYDGTGWARSYRAALRSACAGLSASPGLHLHAVYASADTRPVDVENVLTYNLGYACLRTAAQHGLVLERSLDRVPSPDERSFGHHVRYALAAHGRWSGWSPGALLADVGLADPMLLREPKPALVWLATTESLSSPATPEAPHSGDLLVDLRVGGPQWRGSPLGVMKAVVDGVLSALHSYNGSQHEVLVARVASISQDLNGADLARLLAARSAPLGPWPFMLARGTGVQFSPADDRVVAVRVVRDDRAATAIACSVHVALPRRPAQPAVSPQGS